MASRARTLLRQFLRRTHPDLLQQQDSAVRVTNTRSMQHLNALMELSAPPDTLRPRASQGTASGPDVYPLEFHYLDPTAATPVSTPSRDTSVAATNTTAPSTSSSSSAPEEAAPQLGYVKLTVSPPASLAQPKTSGAILGAAGRKQRAAHEEARARAADRYVAGVLEQLLRRMGVPFDLGTAGTGDEAAHVAGTGTSFAGLGLGRLATAEDDLGRRGGRRRRRSSWGGSASSSRGERHGGAARAAGVFPPRGSLREEMNRMLSDEGFMMMHKAMPQGTGATVGTRRRRRRERGPGAAGSARANANANASANTSANTSAASAGSAGEGRGGINAGSSSSAESRSSDNGVAAAGRGASSANVHRVLQTDPTYAAKVLLSIVAAGRIKSRLGDGNGDNGGAGSISGMGGDGSDTGVGDVGGLAPEADVALAMASVTHALMFHTTWDTFCWIRDDDRVHVSIVQQKEEDDDEEEDDDDDDGEEVVVVVDGASPVDAQDEQSADGGGHTDDAVDAVVIAITLDMNGPQVGEAFDHAFQATRPG